MIELNITEQAKTELALILGDSGTKSLRIEFCGLGWKGSQLKIVLDEQKDDDSKLIIDGINILFRKKDKLYIHKSTIDFDSSYPEFNLKVIPWFNGF